MKQFKVFLSYLICFLFSHLLIAQNALIIDHNCTDITKVPSQWINSAKSQLHIAYGHTSHGSQVTDGMSGLVDFANGGGKGLNLTHNIFEWNHGGTGGALDLHDYAMGGDVGYYPDWVNNTREYLNEQSNQDVNVIMWSWCGQVDDKYASGILYSEFLGPMSQLEKDFPNVKFVYMTGHLDHWDDAHNKAANDSIRRFCKREGKILFDFADIESYNPDGTFFEYASDDCSYYSSNGTQLGNWAEEWRAAHTENVDWYNCGSAHSDPLNANQKAYAVWWMFAKLAGWNSTTEVEIPVKNKSDNYFLSQNYPNPFNPGTVISYQLTVNSKINLKVYDILGNEVATLVNEEKSAGSYEVEFNASTLASGIYFYQIKTSLFVQTRKMLLIK